MLVAPQKTILLNTSQFQLKPKKKAIKQAPAFESGTPLTTNKGEH